MTRPIRAMLVIAWLACVAAAAAPLLRHQYRSGPGAAPVSWPAGSALARSAEAPTVLMFVHARCPCAWASLDELAEALASRPAARVVVVVATPRGTPDDGALANRAARIPGVEVVADDGGEAARFSVATSGQVLLFDPTGRLRFAGGITGSRGHRGGNAGLDALIASLDGKPSAVERTAVFGCWLSDPAVPGAPPPCPDCAAPEPITALASAQRP